MKIDTGYAIAGLLKNIQVIAVENGVTDNFFSGQLDEQMARTESAATDLSTRQQGKETDAIAEIKEKGLVAFIMESHAKRIREEILESMGLTEEDLAKMPPEQRAAVERLIAEETQKRMAAEALMHKGKRKPGSQQLEEIVVGLGPVSISDRLFATKQEAEKG